MPVRKNTGRKPKLTSGGEDAFASIGGTSDCYKKHFVDSGISYVPVPLREALAFQTFSSPPLLISRSAVIIILIC